MYPQIKSTVTISSNELQRFDFKRGHRDSSCSNGHQRDMPLVPTRICTWTVDCCRLAAEGSFSCQDGLAVGESTYVLMSQDGTGSEVLCLQLIKRDATLIYKLALSGTDWNMVSHWMYSLLCFVLSWLCSHLLAYSWNQIHDYPYSLVTPLFAGFSSLFGLRYNVKPYMIEW